jgi:hypothetical protein
MVHAADSKEWAAMIPWRLALPSLTLALLAAGCATTQQVAITDKTYCPFLGSAVCAQLVEGKDPSRFSSNSPAESTAVLRYVNPNVNWSKYKSVELQPVTFWDDADDKLSAKDQHMLTNYFYQALERALAPAFTMVSEPAPGVMRVQVAIEDVSGATPVLRSISMIVPQARVLATLKLAATGTYPFVGSAQAEAKVTDAETGEILAAAVDRRVGGGAMTTAAQWKFGDAENAMTAWSQQMSDRLVGWTQGTAKP